MILERGERWTEEAMRCETSWRDGHERELDSGAKRQNYFFVCFCEWRVRGLKLIIDIYAEKYQNDMS